MDDHGPHEGPPAFCPYAPGVREAVPLEAALFGGPLTEEGTSVQFVSDTKKKGFCLLPSDKQLAHLVQRMLDVEDPGEAEVLSPKEKYIIKTLRNSLQLVKGKYQVSCTWAPGAERPPLNLTLAQARLRNLQRSKAFKDPKIHHAYGQVFVDWEEKGIVKKVPLHSPQVQHVLPHCPIFEERESTPVRPVMGCDVSLNKFLLPGPNLLNKVVGVLLRFRSGKFTIAGDIRQMFLNIRLTPADRPFHCFLSGDGKEDAPPTVYQFQRHVFGNAGSPCVAVFVLKEHAKKSQQVAPAAVDTLVNSTLIDDVLDSVKTEQEAEELLLLVREIIAQAVMKLAKVHTNSARVREVVDAALLAQGALDLSAAGLSPALQGLKTLGLAYRPQQDEFYFTMLPPESVPYWTKRKVLKLFPDCSIHWGCCCHSPSGPACTSRLWREGSADGTRGSHLRLPGRSGCRISHCWSTSGSVEMLELPALVRRSFISLPTPRRRHTPPWRIWSSEGREKSPPILCSQKPTLLPPNRLPSHAWNYLRLNWR